MQLCLDLSCTLSELNQRMTSKEFAFWSALHQSQPRGVERDNFHAALIASTIANVHAQRGKSFAVQDFMHEDHEKKIKRQNKLFMQNMIALSKPKDN